MIPLARFLLAFVLLLLSLAFAGLAIWAARLRLSYVRWYREPEPDPFMEAYGDA